MVVVATVVDEALERVELTGHADEPVAILSGGQRKRLSVAIELLRRPRLLLLDEPTSGLDPASEAHLMEQLRHVARRGTTVVCTTHMMENMRLFDEVIVLGVVDDVGRVAYTGLPAGMLSHIGCRGFADVYEALASGRFPPIADCRKVDARSKAASGAPGTTDRRTPSALRLVARGTASVITPSARRAGIGQLAASPGADPGWSQFLTIAGRALRLIFRDRGFLTMVLAQPIVLGLLVSVTQYDIDKILPLFFFAVVIAIWLGLNNSARDLVNERRQFVRDRLAGLQPVAYLGAKTAVHALIGSVQLLILMAVLRVVCGATLAFPDVVGKLHATSALGLFLVFFACYLGGVAMGLLTSTLVRTEEAAVAALPLLIMRQLLLSVVATGMQAKRYDEERPFRPLVVTIKDRQPLSKAAATIDVASMVCFSRPATLVAESLATAGNGGIWTGLGDVCHLVILLLATWLFVFVTFLWSERRWLNLIGLV